MKTDWERLLLFYYVLKDGIPSWADGSEDLVIRTLLKWPQKRIKAARKRLLEKGMLDKNPPSSFAA